MICMKTVLVNSQLQKKALLIQSLCNLLDEKILIVNSENSRQIEYALGVEDYCVYDTLDVLSQVVDYKKSIIKIKEDKYIIPSTIKPDGNSVTFDSNTAVNAGGAIFNNGTLNIRKGVFTNNKAKSAGGAIANNGTLNIAPP